MSFSASLRRVLLRQDRLVEWPRRPPPLSAAQEEAREQFMRIWHEQLPSRYAAIEHFNHGWIAGLPRKPHGRTLELGAGLGAHLDFENLEDQDYYCLELRPEFCRQLARKISSDKIICGDMQDGIAGPDHAWDRVIAIHTLEHSRHLPAVLKEVKRLLRPGGLFDVVIPCEGGWAHTLARAFSAKRLFERRFHMTFQPIHQNEHVSQYPEIVTLLLEEFDVQAFRFFPFGVPIYWINLCAGFRFRRHD